MEPVDVEVRSEEGRDVVTAGRWEFTIWHDLGDGEPRVLDTDAGTVLGFERPRDIRKTIERIWPEGQRPAFRDTVARNTRGRPAKGSYYLTEAELLKLCARCETPVAEAVLDDMIATYMAVRRRLLAPPVPTAPALPAPTYAPDVAALALLASPAPVPPDLAAALAEPLKLVQVRQRRVLLVAATACDEETLPLRAAGLRPSELRGAAVSMRRVQAWAEEVGRAAATALAAPEASRRAVGEALAAAVLGSGNTKYIAALGDEWLCRLAGHVLFDCSEDNLRAIFREANPNNLADLRESAKAVALASAIRVLDACARLSEAAHASRTLARRH